MPTTCMHVASLVGKALITEAHVSGNGHSVFFHDCETHVFVCIVLDVGHLITSGQCHRPAVVDGTFLRVLILLSVSFPRGHRPFHVCVCYMFVCSDAPLTKQVAFFFLPGLAVSDSSLGFVWRQ